MHRIVPIDPIGIAGGECNYGYVHNPLDWVDPFGLSKGQVGNKARPDPAQGQKDALRYLKKQGVSRKERIKIVNSFEKGTISLDEAGNGLYGIRFHDFGKNAAPDGQYLFKTFTPQINRSGLALPPEWNAMTGIKQWQIKPGTMVINGRAASQFEFGSQYSGGAEQMFVLQPWKYGALL